MPVRRLGPEASRAGLLGTLSRFSIVGVLSTITYLVVANLLLLATQAPATLVSVFAYVAGMAVSFIGQSRFTFRVQKRSVGHLLRFLGLSAMGLGVSFVSVALATATLAIPAVYGTIATAIIIPAVNFLVMKVWVFQEDKETA